ncbi:MAG TPA: VacJ family lipoprotein [Woeseiaceae bacterium]
MHSRYPAARPIGMLLAALSLTACASVPPEQRVEHDPWEGMNRSLYRFNDVVDRATLKPVARGYRKILPEPVRRSVDNFGRNLATPRSAVNNFLQGKGEGGFSELARFIINSTFGIGGLFDIATAGGLRARTEDFGQTAAVWGIPPGPFVMLPFLGPQTLRDALLMPADVRFDPLYHYEVSSVRDPLYVLRIIDLRAQILPLEDLLQDSQDPYVTLRESYLQNREFEIYDGNPPMEDEYFDEFFEEDYEETTDEEFDQPYDLDEE